jgi:hypothetical protein
MSHVLRAAGGTREAAALIELATKIGAGFLMTPTDVPAHPHSPAQTHHVSWYKSHYYHIWDVYSVYIAALGLMALGVRQCWTTLNALISPLPLTGLQPPLPRT